jgi:hypothetical protein
VAALSHFGELSIQEQPISEQVRAARDKFEREVLFKYAEDFPRQIDKILVLWDAVSRELQQANPPALPKLPLRLRNERTISNVLM